MEIEPLEGLIRQHSTTAVFVPLEFYIAGRKPSLEERADWVQRMVSAYDLDERVPDEVRGYYEVARRLHVYGLFEYSFFTVANERTTFAAEFATRLRFLELHDWRIPVERGDVPTRESDVIEATSTWAFDSEFRRRHRKKWQLEGDPGFNGSFLAHLRWAHHHIHLGRYFNDVRLSAIADLRNMAAHPSMNTRVGPHDSARSIEFSWRLINALWGIPAEESFY